MIITQRAFLTAGLLLTLALAAVAGTVASSSPDGLERVAADVGFLTTAREHGLSGSPVADYTVAGVANETLGTGLAGIIGVASTLAVAICLFLLLRRREAPSPVASTPPPADGDRSAD
jgi:cobalt/nickel transport protein